ncbi:MULTISPECIES: ribbon-helix-helix domain-containing protein [Nocardia]|jgi:antitoxin component of RelBE/YafQ-DinJ toxin-antitoxin module|uniref:ribbon-helix-helix domain-containing protein n=1 Tax=Nocardia TaxID=1817 RepID=UPI00343D1B55
MSTTSSRRGRPSKGDRVVSITTRLPAEVREDVDRIAAETGSTVSQVIADLVSRAVGRTDLVLELQDPLPGLAS